MLRPGGDRCCAMPDVWDPTAQYPNAPWDLVLTVRAGVVPSPPCTVAVVAEDLGTTLSLLRHA